MHVSLACQFQVWTEMTRQSEGEGANTGGMRQGTRVTRLESQCTSFETRGE